jgi:hypothetical protein
MYKAINLIKACGSLWLYKTPSQSKPDLHIIYSTLLAIFHFKFITYCDLNEQGQGEAPNKEGKIEG